MLKSPTFPRILQFRKAIRVKAVRCVTTLATDKEGLFDEVALANAKPFEKIPSMPMLPFFGTTWLFLPIIGRYDIKKAHHATADKRRRLGDIFREKVGPLNMVISFDPNDMQTLFKNEGPYPVRPEITSLKAYRESRKDWYKSLGVMILQGKEWHDLRSKTQKHLMKPKAVQAYLKPMQDVSRELVSKMKDIRDSDGEIPDFLNELYKWALESIALVGLDTRLGCLQLNLVADSDGLKMIDSVQTQFDCMSKLEAFSGNLPFWQYFPTPTWRKFSKACDNFTEIAFKYINKSLEELKNVGGEEKDLTLLQSMLMTKGMDISGAVVMVADMLTAGIDTTAHTVGFLLYQIAKNPDKQEILHKEIQNLLPRKEDIITKEVYDNLKYLKACMKESARLHPIVGGIPRVINHDIVLSGYRIPAGTMIVMGGQEMCRDKKYFPEPDKFSPERWLKKDENFHPFSYVPFGVGTRSCIGRRLAEQEIISLMTEIIRNFKIEYHHEDMDMSISLINAPDKPLRFNFIER